MSGGTRKFARSLSPGTSSKRRESFTQAVRESYYSSGSELDSLRRIQSEKRSAEEAKQARQGRTPPRSQTAAELFDVPHFGQFNKSLIKIYKANGSPSTVKYADSTDIKAIIHAIANRIQPAGLCFENSYALRLRHVPTNQVHWLHRNLTMQEVKERYEHLHNPDDCRYELRVRYLPKTLQELHDKDRTTFYYYYNQVHTTYLEQIAELVESNIAIQLGCLELRRFFKDLPQTALEKKSNFELLEREVGLRKFFPSNVIDNTRTRDLRRLIARVFKSIPMLSEEHCVFKFFDILKGISRFDQEFYKCALGTEWSISVEILVGPEQGISYMTTKGSTVLAEFHQVQSIQTTSSTDPAKKGTLQLCIEGTNEPLTITTSSFYDAENIADLIDGYCCMLAKSQKSFIVTSSMNKRELPPPPMEGGPPTVEASPVRGLSRRIRRIRLMSSDSTCSKDLPDPLENAYHSLLKSEDLLEAKTKIGSKEEKFNYPGLKFKLPEGILKEEKEVTFSARVGVDQKEGMPDITPTYECNPPVIFEKPVSMTMRTSISAPAGKEILVSLLTRDHPGDEWKEMQQLSLGPRNEVDFKILHFGGIKVTSGNTDVKLHSITGFNIHLETGMTAVTFSKDRAVHDAVKKEMHENDFVNFAVIPHKFLAKYGSEISVSMERKEPKDTTTSTAYGASFQLDEDYLQKGKHVVYFKFDPEPSDQCRMISMEYECQVNGEPEQRLPLTTKWPRKDTNRVVSNEGGGNVTITNTYNTGGGNVAAIRKDHVYERLQFISEETIKYHMDNKCYKSYTHKKSLDKIKVESDNVTEEPN